MKRLLFAVMPTNISTVTSRVYCTLCISSRTLYFLFSTRASICRFTLNLTVKFAKAKKLWLQGGDRRVSSNVCQVESNTCTSYCNVISIKGRMFRAGVSASRDNYVISGRLVCRLARFCSIGAHLLRHLALP